MEKALPKADHPEEAVLLEKVTTGRVEISSEETARSHSVTLGILSSVQKLHTKEGRSYGEECSFLHGEKPYKKPTWEGKQLNGTVAPVRDIQNLGCVFQDIDILPKCSVASILKESRRPQSPA